jgi:hypothetical protein
MPSIPAATPWWAWAIIAKEYPSITLQVFSLGATTPVGDAGGRLWSPALLIWGVKAAAFSASFFFTTSDQSGVSEALSCILVMQIPALNPWNSSGVSAQKAEHVGGSPQSAAELPPLHA